MACDEHVQVLRKGVSTWNAWRESSPDVRPDLSGADFSGMHLGGANLRGTNLAGAKLINTNFTPQFRQAVPTTRITASGERLVTQVDTKVRSMQTDLTGANLNEAELMSANLGATFLCWANLVSANLSGAILTTTDLRWANLHRAKLAGALLSQAKLDGANLVEADFTKAHLISCHVYGVNVWRVCLEEATQKNLIITPLDEQPVVSVDHLEVAQFIHLLLTNKKIRDVIDTVAKKVVLILGRFNGERLAVLDGIRDELRKHNYVSVLFDFEPPATRDLEDTVRILAGLSRFVVADITDPKSVPHELRAIAGYGVPIRPLLLEGSEGEYALLQSLRRKHDYVLETHYYRDLDDLLGSFYEDVIAPAEAKAQEVVCR
jgi:uncharacterized protein YjbI with pentapeptide repeats